MKKSLVLSAALSAIFVIGSPFVSQGHSLEGTSSEATDTVKTVSSREDRPERAQKTADEVRIKRTEIEQKIAEKRAAIEEKLSGKRVETCAKKQATINRILDNRVSSAQTHLDRFKAIHEKLISFVDAKGLVVDNAMALEVIMDDAQIAAQAAIDAAAVTDFACADADAQAPGKIVTEQVSAQKLALQDYRTAIKDYASAVKNTVETNKTEDVR